MRQKVTKKERIYAPFIQSNTYLLLSSVKNLSNMLITMHYLGASCGNNQDWDANTSKAKISMNI